MVLRTFGAAAAVILLGLGGCAAAGDGEGAGLENRAVGGASAANAEVLAVVRQMPKGGGYSVRDDAFVALERGLEQWAAERVAGGESCPSFCSSGAWLVFLEVVRQRGVAPESLAESGIDPLLADGTRRADGDGLWGRWNANGPGAAVLLHEAGLGENFTNPERARPGDFVKFWWTEAVGGRERGHLAVFLGWGEAAGQRTARYWSSTELGGEDGVGPGYAVREVAWTEVRRVLFSRLVLPEDAAEISRRLRRVRGEDAWLRGLLVQEGRWGEVLRRSGVRE